MKKLILFLAFALLLIAACAKQNSDTLSDKALDIGQQNQQAPEQTPQTSVDKETINPSQTTDSSQQESSSDSSSEVKEFKITAKNWEFSPAVIEVNKGDKVRIIAISIDVPHGFAIPDYGINKRLDPGQPATIEFTADKAGEFTTRCSVSCGAGHKDMKGKLIVH